MPAITLALVLAVAPPRWAAPAQCPDADEAALRIAALAGRVPRDDELEARAQVEGPPWRATIELARGETIDRRTIAAESCAALLEAYAVMIAVSLDPIAVTTNTHLAIRIPTSPTQTPTPTAAPIHARARADAPSTAPAPASAPAPSSASARAPASAPARVPTHRLALRVGSGAGIGGWNHPTGAVELALAWSRNALELDLVGRYWIRRRDALDDRGAVDVELGTVGALACWLGHGDRLTLAGCVGLELGDLVIDGARAPATDRVHFPWVAPLVGGRLAVRVRAPLSLWLGLEAAIPVTRLEATLRATPPITVYGAGSPAARATAGIELRWTIRPRP